MRNEKLGYILWLVFFALVVLWGWKLLDFYVLGPATVKKGMNESVDMVRHIGNKSAKQVQFLSLWAEWERNCEIDFISTSFHGDSFIATWDDTLHVPVFPSIPNEFAVKRVVK